MRARETSGKSTKNTKKIASSRAYIIKWENTFFEPKIRKNKGKSENVTNYLYTPLGVSETKIFSIKYLGFRLFSLKY